MFSKNTSGNKTIHHVSVAAAVLAKTVDYQENGFGHALWLPAPVVELQPTMTAEGVLESYHHIPLATRCRQSRSGHFTTFSPREQGQPPRFLVRFELVADERCGIMGTLGDFKAYVNRCRGTGCQII